VSIAVLPIANLSADRENEYVGDGNVAKGQPDYVA
jgi:TolB-like protein